MVKVQLRTGKKRIAGFRESPLERAPGERKAVDLTLYKLRRAGSDEGRVRREGETLAVRALYYIIGGHFGPPKSLSEHKKYEVLLGPPFFRAASGAAPPDRNGERRCERENRTERPWT